jgi:hypothetical protein
MKTKLIALALIIAATMMFAGCSDESVHSLNGRIERVHHDKGLNSGYGPTTYLRDVVTDVVYISFNGGLAPLLNADGTPVLWSEIESAREN